MKFVFYFSIVSGEVKGTTFVLRLFRASWRFPSIEQRQLLPFCVTHGRRERGAAERRRAGRDSTASGDNDTRRCRDKTCALRSSPGRRRQRGRRAAREQGCHGGGSWRRCEEKRSRARENSKRKERAINPLALGGLDVFCDEFLFFSLALLPFFQLCFARYACLHAIPIRAVAKKETTTKDNALSSS